MEKITLLEYHQMEIMLEALCRELEKKEEWSLLKESESILLSFKKIIHLFEDKE